VPNDGIIYYRWLFNEPRILVANPKAMGEVLVTKSYDFIKPAMLREGLGRLLGLGVLLAEGDEHKVRVFFFISSILFHLTTEEKVMY